MFWHLEASFSRETVSRADLDKQLSGNEIDTTTLVFYFQYIVLYLILSIMETERSAGIGDFPSSKNPDPSRFIEYLSTMKRINLNNTLGTSSIEDEISKPSRYLTLVASPYVPVYVIKHRVITRGEAGSGTTFRP